MLSLLGPPRQQFEALFESHAAALAAMLKRLMRNSHDAEDVFQETAMRIWKELPDAPRLRNPRAWILTIGYRTAMDRLRRRRGTGAFEAEECRDPAPAPDRLAEERELCRKAQDLLDELSPDLRDVIVLHYSGGLSLRATAQATGVPLGTAKSRLNQALQWLRQRLA